MVAVQSAGCAPIVKAWDEGRPTSEFWPDAATLAAGLRVPKAYGDYLILDILKQSGGIAVAVTDAEIMEAFHHWARVEGIFAAPEGAASLAAYRKLRAQRFLLCRGQSRALQYRLRSEVSGCNREGEKERERRPRGKSAASSDRTEPTLSAVVILSAAFASLREAKAESKDPYKLECCRRKRGFRTLSAR